MGRSLLALLWLSAAAHAQSTGFITGSVTDASQAAIPGVRITITAAGKHVSRCVTRCSAEGASVSFRRI